MRAFEQRDFEAERLRAIVRVQGAGLLLCLVVILILAVVLLVGRGGHTARGIFIDGKLTVMVHNKQAAEAVSERLLKEAQGSLPGAASFKESWSDETCRVEGRSVLTIEEATDALRPLLTVLVEAVAICVDDRNVLVMASRELAEAAIKKLKQSYADLVADEKSITQVKTREKIELAEVQVQPDQILTDIGTAVNILKAGDHKLTVVVVTEGTRDVAYRDVDERKDSETLPKGTEREVREGRPGKKRIYQRYVYENGKLVRTDKLRVEILRECIPRRILVGTGEVTP